MTSSYTHQHVTFSLSHPTLNEDDNNHVATEVNGDVHNPSSDNLYHSDFYDQSQKIVKNRALHNFESSYEDGNKVRYYE